MGVGGVDAVCRYLFICAEPFGRGGDDTKAALRNGGSSQLVSEGDRKSDFKRAQKNTQPLTNHGVNIPSREGDREKRERERMRERERQRWREKDREGGEREGKRKRQRER